MFHRSPDTILDSVYECARHLVPFTAPNRSSGLPRVFTVQKHPLVQEPYGKIYILLQDRSKEGADLARDSALQNADMHPQSDQDIENLGYPILDALANDYVFLRDKDNASNPVDDVLIAFTMSPSFYGPELLQKLRHVQGNILGDSSKITKESPKVQFERCLRAIPNSRGDRCYPLGTSFQDGAQLTAPAKTMKVAIPEPLDLCRSIIQTGATCAMQGLRLKAPELAKLMDRQAIVLNTPRIGIHENTSYPSFQLNIAPGIWAKCAEKDQTIKALGVAGSAHVDPHDSDVGLTCMLNLSKSQVNVDTEIFIVYGLGIAVKLPEFTSFYFSGLFLHGGIQPILRYEDPTIPVYYRLTLICYPPKDILHNNGSLAFAQLPVPAPMSEQRLKEIMSKPEEQLRSYLRTEFKGQGRIMNYGPEIRKTWFPQIVPPTCEGQTTFLRDGIGIMERKSYVNMITSVFFQYLSHFLGHADANCEIQIDADTFFKSFSYRSRDDQRVHPNPEILHFLCAHGADKDGEKDGVGHFLEDSRERWIRYREKREASIGQVKQPRRRGLAIKSKCSKNLKRSNDQKKGRVSMDENEKYYSTTSDENSQDSETEYGSDYEPDVRNLKRKRSLTDIGGQKRSLRPRISHGVAMVGKKKASSSVGKKRSSARHTAAQEASSLLRVRQIRRKYRVVVTGMVGASPAAVIQQPSTSSVKENPKGTTTSRYDHLEIGVQDIDHLEERLRLVKNSPGALNNTMTGLRGEIHLPHSGRVLMMRLALDLKMLENDRELVSASGQALIGQQLLMNLLWWVTLEHEIELSLDQDHWLASFRRRVEDLSHKKDPVTLYRAEVHESFRSVPDCEIAPQYEYGCTTYRVRNTEGITRIAHSNINEQMLVILAKFFHRSSESKYQAIFIREVVLASSNLAAVFLLPVQLFVDGLLYHLQLPARPSDKEVRRLSRTIACQSFSSLLNSSDTRKKLDSLDCEIPAVFPAVTDLFNLSRKIFDPDPDSVNVIVPKPPLNDYSMSKFILRGFGKFPVIKHPRIKSFALLVFLLLPLLCSTSRNQFTPVHRAYMDFVERNTDLRLPFRDRASSRQRILEDQEGGPFTEDHLLTREGFFSALIFRGVTYGTQFLLQEKTFYSDLEDWSSQYNAVCSKGHPESHFCKKDAYGTPTNRGTCNVPDYWEAAKDENLQPCHKKRFTDFFWTIKGSSKAPAFGGLTTYLLSADYATAGGLQMPSLHELGRIIHQLNRGAKKGLKLLGYKCSDVDNTTTAFIEVHDGLQAFLTNEEQRDMDFGAIFVEHALCKLSRFKVSKEFRDVCREWDVPCIV